jgi:hypothetical protein
MMSGNASFIRYLTATTAIGLTVGAIHGASLNMGVRKKRLSESFPDILTHSVSGMIIAQYFPIAVPYHLYKKTDCTYIQMVKHRLT